MLKWMLAAASLVLGTAHAADLGELQSLPSIESYAYGPLDAAKGKAEEKMDEKDAEAEARLKALEEARSGKGARVVVLKWKGTTVDYANDTLQRNVRTRIARPDATFFPSIDLYQVGRREKRDGVRPDEERAAVPDATITMIETAVADIETVPWNAMSEADWGITSNQLKDLAENELWFIDRPELREPLFRLYAQIGRAAENQNNPIPPYYANIGGMAVNYYWYLAGALAHEDPALLNAVQSADMAASIGYYKEMLDNGQIRKMTLAFEMEDKWDAAEFTGEYQVFINGLEVVISDPDSFYQSPPGRVDIYLKRSDGHSLSERIEIDKLDDKIYFIRDVARKRMGLDLIDQLMEHPNECTPELDGDSFHFISIYAKLHPDGEIYVAVPEAGNPNKILLWRFDRPTNTLQKVLDDVGAFPVHFVALGGVGVAFNGANVTAPEQPTQQEIEECLAEDPTDTSCAELALPEPQLNPAGIPIGGQLRIHYSRFMFAFGVEAMPALAGPSTPEDARPMWQDYYRTDDYSTVDGAGNVVYHEERFNRLIWGGLGFVLGQDAMLGIGPRGLIRVGKYNVPNVVDLTVHGGMTMEPPGMEKEGRVRPVLDVDFFAGALVPQGNSQLDKATLSFGLTAGGGLKF